MYNSSPLLSRDPNYFTSTKTEFLKKKTTFSSQGTFIIISNSLLLPFTWQTHTHILAPVGGRLSNKLFGKCKMKHV